jgi:hypothetical protein
MHKLQIGPKFVPSLSMKKVKLIFPDNFKLSGFILNEHPSGADSISFRHSLTSILTDKQIAKACTSYGAILEGNIIIVNKD